MYKALSICVTIFVASLVISGQDPAGSAPAQTERNTRVPKQISGGVLNAKATSLPKPVYPPAAAALKASGQVSVQVLIDENGNVISAEAVSGHPLLRAASVEAARAATFSPTKLSGQPVKVSGVITYNFVPPADTGADGKGIIAEIPPEDRDKIWVFGALLSFVQTADAEIVRMMGDEQEFYDILRDLSTDLSPDMAQYKPVLERLNSTDLTVRSEAAREFLKQIRKDFNKEQNWQIDAGEQIGFIMAEVVRQKLMYVKTGAQIDDSTLKLHLRRLADLLAAAPPDALPSVKAKIRPIAAFADQPSLATEAKLSELVGAMAPLFEGLDK